MVLAAGGEAARLDRADGAALELGDRLERVVDLAPGMNVRSERRDRGISPTR